MRRPEGEGGGRVAKGDDMRDGEIVVDMRNRSKIQYTMPVDTDAGDVFFQTADGKQVSVKRMVEDAYEMGHEAGYDAAWVRKDADD